MAKVLTVKAVEKVKPGPTRRELPDGGLPGLYLVIQPSGRRSFAVRTRISDRPVKVTLAARDLVAARAEAREVLAGAREGKTPAQIKADREAQRPLTFNELADAYLERWARPNKRTWRQDATTIASELRPAWGRRTAASITRREIVEIIDRKARVAPIRANRLRALLIKLLGWAVDVDLLASSPAAGVKAPTRERSRDRVLDDAELAAFWRATGRMTYPWGPYLRLLAFTAQREAEVAGMHRSDLSFDGEQPVWHLPAGVTKANRPNDVALAPAALDLLRGLPRIAGHGLVFTTTATTPISGFSKTKRRLDKLMLDDQAAAEVLGGDPGEVELRPWRLHDLRRTAASTMARLGHAPHIVAACLNHAPRATLGVTAVYVRHQFKVEKRTALEAWANHLEALDDPAGAKIVRLRA